MRWVMRWCHFCLSACFILERMLRVRVKNDGRSEGWAVPFAYGVVDT